MKTSRFNEGQIIKAIKEHEGGRNMILPSLTEAFIRSGRIQIIPNFMVSLELGTYGNFLLKGIEIRELRY
jgi:hypothetical protein